MSFQLKRNTTTILKIEIMCYTTKIYWNGNNTRALVFSDIMFHFEFEVVERISRVLTYRTVTPHTLYIVCCCSSDGLNPNQVQIMDVAPIFFTSFHFQPCLLKMTTNMRCSRVYLAAAGRLRHHSLCSIEPSPNPTWRID